MNTNTQEKKLEQYDVLYVDADTGPGETHIWASDVEDIKAQVAKLGAESWLFAAVRRSPNPPTMGVA